MLEINLLPVREARRKADFRQQVMQLILVLLVVSGGIGIIQSRVRDRVDNAVARVSQMENDIRQFKPQLDQVAAFRKKKASLEKKIEVIEGLDKARRGPVRVMSELAARAPERLWLESVSTKGKAISIKGKSLDNELVALFVKGLNESAYFDNVDLDSTKLGTPKDGGLKLVSFMIRAQVVNDPASKKG